MDINGLNNLFCVNHIHFQGQVPSLSTVVSGTENLYKELFDSYIPIDDILLFIWAEIIVLRLKIGETDTAVVHFLLLFKTKRLTVPLNEHYSVTFKTNRTFKILDIT